MVHTKMVLEEGWSFIRGRKQCKPKHVSSGIVVLNVRWSLIRVVSQEGDYCTSKWFLIIINFKIFSSISSEDIPPRSTCKCLQHLYQSVAIQLKYMLLVLLLRLLMYLGL